MSSGRGRGPAGRFLLGPRLWWQEAIVLFALYQLYTLIRAGLPERAGAAFANAERLIDLERLLGIFHEETVQEWVLGSDHLVRIWNVYYGSIHFVVPVVVLVLLWRRDRDRYRLWRNAFGVVLTLGLIGFVVLPLAPPRLLPPESGFVDTKPVYGGVGPVGGGDREDTNPFAAMPSLHMAWSTWCAFALYPALRRWWSRALLVAYPVMTLVAIVVTANHFFLDAVGGWLVLAAGVGVAVAIDGRKALTDAPS